MTNHTWTRAGLLLSGLLCLGAAPKEPGAASVDSDFWMNIAQPGRQQYQAALRHGRELFDGAIRARPPDRKRLLEALASFEQATRHSPGAAEGHFWVGKTAYLLERMKTTIDAFTAVRRLQPDFGEEFGICFKLGIAYSKLGRFEDAVQEYNRGDRLLMADPGRVNDRSVMHANAAESLMAMGRLDEAIQRYQESVALQPRNFLGWWGLAVAYDRDEQVSKAREAVSQALAVDPAMSKLTDDGVFFIPEGDIHYYFGLGQEVKGDGARAKQEWSAFLAQLPGNQWAFRARQHLAELGGAPGGPRTRRLAPFPRAQAAPGEPDSLASDQNAARYRIQGYLYRIRQCYQSELRQHPTLAGELRLGITIARDGRPVEVKVLSSTLKRPSLQSCVVSTVKTISFNRPSSGASFKITFPMAFKPVVQ